ncbi:Tyrosyl-tRNA synthetase- class Ib-bacterial/mitochondrial [Striga hermonthica]|uniref:tyrosine--tRNA ligase n=1 Tax=Striga hermonthica TaxID=68872 RepID=A0A9N7R082_STRHE|nr:Tyrosyl-tRNA synthetase- class Ib-bacterial/mitochondrial [Striga hermonthica]
MGGDLKKIQVTGQYLIEIWKAVGMNLEGGQVEFLWSSEEINSRAHEYWPLVMDIARRNKLPRIVRCCQIMGRSEQDELSAAQIFYPCMQCADIFFLKADICQLGMDQRKVNVLAREYCDDIKRKNKPIILSHHMLPGLQEGQEKMSKSDPSSSIYMEDEEANVNLKIKKAFCPPKVVEKNPCLEYIKYIIFPWFNEFTVERKPENGGDKTYKNFKDLAGDYESGELHPGDLKPALAKALNQILQPVRDHFNTDPKAKDLLKRVKLLITDIVNESHVLLLIRAEYCHIMHPNHRQSKSVPLDVEQICGPHVQVSILEMKGHVRVASESSRKPIAERVSQKAARDTSYPRQLIFLEIQYEHPPNFVVCSDFDHALATTCIQHAASREGPNR